MKVLRVLVVTTVVVFLVGPILVVTVASFNAKQFLDFPVTEFSSRWYTELITDGQWRRAVLNSLLIAVAAAALAVVIALPMALVLARWRSRLRSLFFALGVLPFLLPPVISAVGALVFWTAIGHPGRIENVIVAHAVFFSTIPLITITLGLEGISDEIDEAALTLGADGWVTFRTITLPMLVPSIVTGYVAALVLSLNEYIIAFMVAGFTVETLPIKIFNALRYGFTPTIAAVAVVFTALSLVALSALARFGNIDQLLGTEAETP